PRRARISRSGAFCSAISAERVAWSNKVMPWGAPPGLAAVVRSGSVLTSQSPTTDALALPGLPPETDGGGDTIEGFSLDEAARFAAQLAVARSRAEALARRGVDEATWALAEVGWMTRIARKAFAGDQSLLET